MNYDTSAFAYATLGGTNIGDFVWYDADADGFQDPGEIGIPGVQITVTGPGGFNKTDTTDASGHWLVTGITVNGVYTVTLNTGTLPAGLDTTPTNWPLANINFTVIVGIDVLNADFGFIESGASVTATIGDFVWFDEDGDGVKDGLEPGLGSVSVDLLSSGGQVIASTETDNLGFYDFLGVLPGDYRVEVTDVKGITNGLTLARRRTYR